ncbi:phosphatidate phosphatase APP1 [Kineococcus aurantiacus]|uniref:Phosphatidate phosphatase APP1 n=1 Tax=Kineococcus aurantiacus TaxID=37633 RepID=A0A7Y9DQG2_9ACTN|nr:phosphatidate phosphatase APP1 [Kineococcus aurantiacus]
MINGPALTPAQRRARRVQEARRDLADLAGDLTPRPGEHGLHRAARIEDAVKGLVGSRLRRRGYHARALAYPGYGGPGWVRVFGRVLLGREGTLQETERDEARSVRGWRNFLTVPVAGAAVTVRIGGHERVVHTSRDGYVDERVEVDLPPGTHEVVLTVGPESFDPGTLPPDVELVEDDTEGGAERPEDSAVRHSGTAPVVVVGPDPVTGLLSDIDDTVVVTRLPRPLVAAWNSFVLDERARVPVNGMAELYRQVVAENPGAPVLYLSTGAWNAAPTLTRFLRRSGYPDGPLLLTDWGPTNTGWFRDGSAHKRGSLARLAQELPQVRWLLVGDDGQHDPTLYAEFLAAAPERVAGVGIRRLTPAEQLLAGGHPLASAATPESSPVPWVTGDDGYEILHRWYRAGILQAP